jgi:hypothetical protein
MLRVVAACCIIFSTDICSQPPSYRSPHRAVLAISSLSSQTPTLSPLGSFTVHHPSCPSIILHYVIISVHIIIIALLPLLQSTSNFFFVTMVQQPPVGHGLLVIEDSRSHSVGLLWTSDHPDVQTSTWLHTTLTRDKHPWPRLDSNPQSQQASRRRPTP